MTEAAQSALHALRAAVVAAGLQAETGATTWEILRDLARALDDSDRAMGRPPRAGTPLWAISDVLRAEEQEPRVSRPPELEGEP